MKVGEHIGVADEMLFAKEEKTYFRKRCTFFIAEIVAHEPALTTEPDHRLVWLSVEEAIRCLVHESHGWAVQSVFKKKPDQSPEPTRFARGSA